MNTLDTFRRLFMGALDLVHQAQMRDAQLERLATACGVSLEIPDRPGAVVTSEIQAYILAARSRYSEFEWLYPSGPRDQICMRFGISRQQVAGVLAAKAQRDNGSGIHGNGKHGNGAPESGPDLAPTTPALGVITDDPATWPTRPGPRPVSPTVDRTDWQIAQAVLAADRWEELREQISATRLLTTQQVAGMKAVLSRGQTPRALRDLGAS